jgi:hypothetical protein
MFRQLWMLSSIYIPMNVTAITTDINGMTAIVENTSQREEKGRSRIMPAKSNVQGKDAFIYSVFSLIAFSAFSTDSSTAFPAFSMGPSFSQATRPMIIPAAIKDRILRFKIDMTIPHSLLDWFETLIFWPPYFRKKLTAKKMSG